MADEWAEGEAPAPASAPSPPARRGDFAATLATNILLAVLGAATGVLAARALGPTGRGELAAVQTLPSWLATFALLGMSDGVVHFSARRPNLARVQMVGGMALAGAAGLGMFVIGWFAVPIVLHSQSDATVATGRIYMGVIIPFTLMLSHSALRGVGRFAAWNVLRLVAPVGWVIALCIILVRGDGTVRVLSVLLLAMLTMSGLVGIAMVMFRQSGRIRPHGDELRELLHFGWPTGLSALPQAANMRADQIAMAAFLPARQLGYYAAAVAWSAAAAPLLTSVANLVHPRIAAIDTLEEKATSLAATTRRAVLLAVGSCTAVGIATPVAIPLLFGRAFRPAVAPGIILTVAIGVLTVGNVLEEGLKGLGRTRRVLHAETVGLATTAIALIALLRYGPAGAAVASVIGYGAVGVAAMASVSSTTGLPRRRFLVPTSNDVSALVGIVTDRLPVRSDRRA